MSSESRISLLDSTMVSVGLSVTLLLQVLPPTNGLMRYLNAKQLHSVMHTATIRSTAAEMFITLLKLFFMLTFTVTVTEFNPEGC